MRKDLMWLVALFVVMALSVWVPNDTDLEQSQFHWQQELKTGDEWSFTVVRTWGGADVYGRLCRNRVNEPTVRATITGSEYRALMAALQEQGAWSLQTTGKMNGPWAVVYRIKTPMRSHEVRFSSDSATPEHLALARYIDMENPTTSGQLRELSKGERAIVDKLGEFFNDKLNSMMAPPP